MSWRMSLAIRRALCKEDAGQTLRDETMAKSTWFCLYIINNTKQYNNNCLPSLAAAKSLMYAKNPAGNYSGNY